MLPSSGYAVNRVPRNVNVNKVDIFFYGIVLNVRSVTAARK